MNRPKADRFSVVWEWHDGTYDRAQITQTGQGWHITGRHGDTRYLILLDADFTCQSLEATNDMHSLMLNRTQAGWFETTTGLIPSSAQAIDLDLGWSAVTNTFPIKRLQRAEQAEGTFDVLMIGHPDLETRVVRQSYARREDGWHYSNLDSGFSALLTVDKTGLVTEYPGLCSRKDLSA